MIFPPGVTVFQGAPWTMVTATHRNPDRTEWNCSLPGSLQLVQEEGPHDDQPNQDKDGGQDRRTSQRELEAPPGPEHSMSWGPRSPPHRLPRHDPAQRRSFELAVNPESGFRPWKTVSA